MRKKRRPLPPLPADAPVGLRLWHLREAAGKSYRELAGQLGIHHSRLSRLESGETQPKLEFLAQIAPAYGTTAEQLWEWAGYGRSAMAERIEHEYRLRGATAAILLILELDGGATLGTSTREGIKLLLEANQARRAARPENLSDGGSRVVGE